MVGFDPGDLVTYSYKKCVAKMIAYGCTLCPPITSLCIRCGLSMGGFKERYLKYEAAGYHYVGRCDSSLDQKSKLFAFSQHLFGFSSLETLQADYVKRRLGTCLKEVLNQLDNFESAIMHLLTQLFASVCRHYDFLKTYISCECPLVDSVFYRDIPQ